MPLRLVDLTYVIPNGLYDQCFNLVSRNSLYDAGLFGLPPDAARHCQGLRVLGAKGV
jgi:hypothetical protein